MTGGAISGWTLTAASIVGAALAVTGGALQSVLRNPLAEPYLMGTVGGGALFAALATVLGWTAAGSWVMPMSSFAGSCLSLALVMGVASITERRVKRESASPLLSASGSTLVLTGFVVGGFTGSLDMLVLSYAKSDDFAAISKWLYGSLNAVTPFSCVLGGAVFVFVFALLLVLSRHLDVLELGRNEAECLGVNTRLILFVVLFATSLMTAVSVALAGAIGFVGLVVPHFVRRLCGPRMKRVLPYSAVAGGVFLALAQLLVAYVPGEVPVGVVAAIVGSPILFGLIVSRRNGAGWDV